MGIPFGYPLLLYLARLNLEKAPRRRQPAQPTGTQGEEVFAHRIGVPSLLFGRPGTSGELETQQPFCGFHYTTRPRHTGSTTEVLPRTLMSYTLFITHVTSPDTGVDHGGDASGEPSSH